MILLIIALIVECIALVIDLLVPPGYADWLLYILPLLIVLPSNRREYLFSVAAFASLLLILRTIIYPLEPGGLPINLSRRVAGFVALWILTFVLAGRIKSYRAVQESAILDEAVFSSITDGLVLAEPDGTIVRINPAASRIAGLKSEQEGLGKISKLYTEWMIFDRDDYLLPIEFWPFSRSLRGERFEQYICKVEKENAGGSWYGSFSGAPVLNKYGQLRLAVTTFRDVTDIILAQQRLNGLNKELEHKASDLEISNRELEAFSYSVSHDLRSPLNSILGFSDLLLQFYSSTLDEKARDFLSRITRSAKDMAQLIDDLLSLSRAGHQELNRHETDLGEIASDIIKELRHSKPERVINISIQDHINANVDPGLFKIALSNLLRNSWKFTKKQPLSRIEFGTTIIDKENVYFIRDNGAGFDMKFVGRLFQPFNRLHGDPEFKGTGIGLTIVQRIITRHGGRIWGEGKVGEGATFYFTIE
jgi:signal transduction histidine kinase